MDEKKIIGLKWVHRSKLNSDGTLNKHKAILVLKGYYQEYGVDYSETFAPVAKLETVRMLIALAAQNKWTIHQMDVKSAFLNGNPEDEIYVEQPTCFVILGHDELVYRLRKALYGLKQAPRSWYERLHQFLISQNINRSMNDTTMYFKFDRKRKMIISVYVDDLFITGNSNSLIEEFKNSMMEEFEMTDLGLMTFFLGLEIKQMEQGIFVS
jgi:hypothetical protein